MANRIIIEGTTWPLNDQLFITLPGASSPSTPPGTLSAVTLNITPHGASSPKTMRGTVSITDGAAWKVSFTPALGDLIQDESPYSVRWWAENGPQTIPFPDVDPDLWTVRKP